MSNAQELSTAVRHRLNVIAIVFNYGTYGNVKRIQQGSFGGRIIASDLHNPDSARLAELFGPADRRAHTLEQLREVLQWVLSQDVPAVIEMPVGRDGPTYGR